VQLIPPQYVRPFVKRGKNDRDDAEAIAVAAAQPSIASVPVKSAEQQAAAMLLSVRELLVRQRTQLVNALRGHAAEMGVVAPLGEKGLAGLRTEVAAADDAAVPSAAKQAIALLGQEVERIEMRRRAIDTTLMQQHKANPVSRRLVAIPGIGLIAALNLALRVDVAQFKSARHLPLGSGWFRANARLPADSAWVASAAPATSGCASCWCWARPRSSNMPNPAGSPPLNGCSTCSAASRASLPLWLWPTRRPALCGPLMTRGEAYRPRPAAA
jgi:transposase